MEENILEIKNLSKSFINSAGFRQIVLENLNLKLTLDESNGNFISILAPLGSGKTTLLKIIAGLESAKGEVSLKGKSVTEPTGEIIFIPEKSAAYPWLNVKENILLPSKLNKGKKRQSIDTGYLINLVGLSGYEDYFTSSLNSGFNLRIAVARALTFNPKIILLDDVLKNLDGETRFELIDLFKLITNETKVSFIMTTTNISDALLLSRRIILMNNNPGKIIKEIDIPKIEIKVNSEIFTKFKTEIEATFKSQGMFHSIFVTM